MKFTSAVASLALAGIVAASDGGEMDRLMQMKEATRARQRAEGVFDQQREFLAPQSLQKCVNGKTDSAPGQVQYGCDKVDLHGFLSHAEMTSQTKEGNDIWGGWSPCARSLADLQAGLAPVAANSPLSGRPTAWALSRSSRTAPSSSSAVCPPRRRRPSGATSRSLTATPTSAPRLRATGCRCLTCARSACPLMPVSSPADRQLLTITTPVTFDINKDLHFWWNKFGSAHNVIANADEKMIYVCGTSRRSDCRGGLYMLDVSNPDAITTPGCLSADGYTHDAQAVIYNGPDAQYQGKPIVFAYNEDSLTIWDASDKKAPKIISKTAYVGASYTHQGWLTSMTDMTFLLMDDELDEKDQVGVAANQHTTTYLWNVTSLANPINTGTYQSPAKSIDHNQYVKDGLSYQSNYGSGLRIVDVSSIEADPTGKGFKQVGFFDCHPEDDAQGGVADFFGSWSVYPYFPSGYLLLNSIERGVYSLKYNA